MYSRRVRPSSSAAKYQVDEPGRRPRSSGSDDDTCWRWLCACCLSDSRVVPEVGQFDSKMPTSDSDAARKKKSCCDRSRLRSSSLFWCEKALIVVDALQAYALLWSLSQRWPWPYLWLRYTRLTPLANLDYFILSEFGAPMGATGADESTSIWGEMPGVLHNYCIPLGGVVPALLLAAALVTPKLMLRGGKYGRLVIAWQLWHSVKAVLLFMGYLLIVPCALAVFRMYDCTGGALDADPLIPCYSLRRWVPLGLVSLSFATAGAVLLLVFVRIPLAAVVYRSHVDHERFLQRWEIEWDLETSDEWIASQMWVFSSFKRRAVHFRALSIIHKLLLVVCYTLLRDDPALQAQVFWIIVVLWASYIMAVFPFRCWSSNAICVLVQVVLVLDATMGMLTAVKVKDSLLVASRQTIFLLCVNVLGVLVAFILSALLRCGCTICREPWPSNPTRTKLLSFGSQLHEWVVALRETSRLTLECHTTPTVVVPIHKVEVHLGVLRSCWVEAKARQSILEPSLNDALQHLTLVHEQLCRFSMYPNDKFLEIMEECQPGIAERDRSRVLMPKRKRGILNKLLAMRFFLKVIYLLIRPLGDCPTHSVAFRPGT